MNRNKKSEAQQVQVTSVSRNVEFDSGNKPSLPVTDRILKEPPVNRQRINSVIEPFELDSLPLGLADDEDSVSRSVLASRLQNETKRVFLSSTEGQKNRNDTEQELKEISFWSFERHATVRPLFTNENSKAIAVVPDLADFSSTNDLIPLTFAALNDEKSRKFVWLDNISLMAMTFTLSNIWRLPTFIYFNYSGEALIAYIILMTVVGLPLYVLELSLGQFGQSGIVQLWTAVPFFKGIGAAQMIAGLYQAFYFPALMTWAFQFGILGMGDWNDCKSSWGQNLTVCLCQEPGDSHCSKYGIISEEEACFESGVLHKTGENMNYKMLAMLAVVMILVTLSVSFGHKVMKIILSLSGILTALLLSAAMALAFTHPNNSLPNSTLTAQYGINLLTPVDLWSFGRGEVWYGAMVQVLFSLAVGFGTLPSHSSSSHFSRNAIRDGILMWLFNILFAVITVVTTFAWIGVSGLDATEVVKTNAFIYFVYYNISGSLWAGLAFGLIFFAGINSMLPLLYAILQNLCENFPLLEKERNQKWTCVFLCSFFWIINIPGLIPVGNEVVMMWDHYAAGGVVLSCLIVHMIGWLWAYGVKNLIRDLQFMIGRPISYLWNISWGFVTILILIIAELWGFIGMPLDGTRDCRFPIWVVAVGWSFYLLALAVAVFIIIKTVIHQAEYGLLKKVANSMKPDRNWGPRDPLFYSQWKRTIDQLSGIAPYSKTNTLSRRLKDEGEQDVDLSNCYQNTISKASITVVPVSNYKRHYDERGLTIEY